MPVAGLTNGMTREEMSRSTSTAPEWKKMHHETSVNVNVKGPSAPVNVYGSPVAPNGQRNEESAATSQAVPSANVTQVVSSILHFPRELGERIRPEIVFVF